MPHYHSTRKRLRTSWAARRVVARTWPLVGNAVGNITPSDATFLLSLLARVRPRNVLELGVASGTSTLVLLRMLKRSFRRPSLLSIDLAETYFADTAKPVGYLVSEHCRRPPSNWRLVTRCTASTFAQHPDLASVDHLDRFDLVFIDAHH